LAPTGLIQPGSQIRYLYRLALGPDTQADEWVEYLKERFPKAGWRIRGLGKAAPGLQRFITRMGLFLTFVGLATLLVGGIGVGNAVSNYLDSKTRTIATLKCLGSSGGLVMRIYFLQIAALAGLGIGAGLLFSALAPAAAAWALAGRLPVDPEVGFFPLPLVLPAAFGALTAFTFSLWPLGRGARVPAAALFRDRVQPGAILPTKWIGFLVASGGLGLAVLTVATASHKGFALWFVGCSVTALLALSFVARGLAWISWRVWAGRLTVLCLALANLHRPGAQTSSITVSLGLGLAVLIAVALIENNLSRQISERLPKNAPAFFFLDIQPHQVAGFDGIIRNIPHTGELRRVASLRGRIVKIGGVPVDEAEIDPDVAWAVRGDRALTYLPKPLEGARITAGRWWPADYTGPPLISLDANIARGFGLGLGDTLSLNILGREVEAEIANLREIDWRSLRFDFAIIFAPGTLEGAPQTHIASLRAEAASEDVIERRVNDAYGNISVIRVREVLAAAAKILSGIGTAVRSTGGLTILAGALVLAGAVAAARRRRVYDAVVLKVLGARRRTLLAAFLIEYGVLGLAAGLIAAFIGTLTAWAVVVVLMD
ncbi:MAG: ABC transporter permease, partial [Rhodospirillales bacterium]|nr:ABC transporter permease [Rhodospirillales bacterium]